MQAPSARPAPGPTASPSGAWGRQVATAMVRWGIDGAPLAPLGGGGLRLRSALELAHGVSYRAALVGLEPAIDELIERQARWNGCTGFLTSVGGFTLLPLQLPATLLATWVIQTRLVATIAALYGLDLEHEAVRSEILLTLLGEEAADVLRQLGVKTGQRLAARQLQRLPAGHLAAINRAVGVQLLGRAGRGGLLPLERAIPLVGGVVGGGVDYLLTRELGQRAARQLRQRQRRQATASGSAVIDVEILG